jgi:translation initiation factor 4E
MENIDSVEKLCALNETIPEEMVKSSMLYVMRNGINPIWEDPFNCDGGAFSFRLSKVGVHFVWKNLFYLLCGETLCIDRKYNALINGITISPKKEFCILKIWMRDRTVHDPNIFVDIKDLPKTGCLFKKHGPDM